MTSILRKMRVAFLTIVTCIEALCVTFISLSPYLTSNPYYLTYTIPSTTPPAEPINDKKHKYQSLKFPQIQSRVNPDRCTDKAIKLVGL